MKRGWKIAVGLVVSLALAGCNLSTSKPKPTPTVGGTPIPWATANPQTVPQTDTPTVILPSVTSAPTLTPITTEAAPGSPTPTVTQQVALVPTTAPTLTYTPMGIFTLTPSSTPTSTPFVIATPVPTSIPQGPAPTVTNTPLGILSLTPAPTVIVPTAAPTLTNTPMGIWTVASPPPTFTPVIIPQTPPTPLPATALVCPTCDQLRLRSAPGTAGGIITMLAANTSLTVVGRTEDNVWVQVITPDGTNGWVAAQYLVFNGDLNTVSVTGTVVNAAESTGSSGSAYVSGISSHARQIFLDGRAKGNSAHTFTRVGDSITAASQFLTPIGLGNYNLGDYSYLGGAIGFFSGPNGRGQNPFSATSLAARNGWGTTSVLSPANADPNLCKPGETPLECEYRLVKPSVALIMFGTNDSGGLDSATYRANLEGIVQISINMGVIPVLSTIPPKHYDPATDGRVNEFNQIIIATARAYDIPLWDYWSAMINLPSEGLSPDGVHPNIPPDDNSAYFDASHLNYGFPVRNLTALQVLYALWQQVLYDGDQAVPATLAPSSPGGGASTYSCEGAPTPRLTVGAQGRVTPGAPNKLRSGPSKSADQVGLIPGEAVFTVVAGPQCADGFNWWQISYNGQVGWTSEGSGSEYWLEPYP